MINIMESMSYMIAGFTSIFILFGGYIVRLVRLKMRLERERDLIEQSSKKRVYEV